MTNTMRATLVLVLLCLAFSTAWADATLHVSNHRSHGVKIMTRHRDGGERGEWHERGWVSGGQRQDFQLRRGGTYDVKAVDRKGNTVSRKQITVGEGETVRWRLEN